MMTNYRLSYLALSVTAALAATSAQAQRANDSKQLEEIVISAHPLSGEGLAQAAVVLSDEELDRAMAPSIGETVSDIAGIHNSSFGQAAGRPIIHGLGGARVRVMEDRIDTLDVSVTSADHAVTIEPFLANRIEILKGSSTLLYGPGAIGGIVDVHTGRIPHTITPGDTFATGKIDIRFADNADQKNGAIRLDGSGENIAWHIDAFTRDADEYDIPGFAESAVLRAAEEAEGEEEEEGEEEAFGFVPGSQLESDGGAIGLSFIGERVIAGFAVSTIDSAYGLPGGHGHEEEEGEEEGEEEEEEGNPLLDLKQTRFDLEFALADPFARFDALNIRVGVNDYEHQEIEPSGEVATNFDNDAVESRVELTYSEFGQWEGAFGVQYSDRDFSAVGEEAFVPPVETQSLGAFWVTQRSFNAFDLEAGLRLDQVDHDPSEGPSRDFTGISASIGAVIPVNDALSFGVLLDRSERAPVAEELYSNGPHLATNRFEIGDLNLSEEKATNLQATANYRTDLVDFTATAYLTNFDDYIFQSATGEIEDGLAVEVFDQEDADFVGFNTELSVQVAEFDQGSLAVNFMYDTVSADIDVSGNDNLPRIPASRHGFGFDMDWGSFSVALDYRRVDEQNDFADLELPTGGYDDISAQVAYGLDFGGSDLEFYLQGKNLTDDEQRDHTSFIKDFAPRPGRSVVAGVRLEF